MDASDAELIRQCLRGDNAGFDTLVRRYQEQIASFCYRVLGDTDLASDAAQEAFLKAYHALPSFRLDASFLSWLFRIAKNTCLDMVRARARRGGDSLDEGEARFERLPARGPFPEDSAMAGERSRLLHQAILSLPVKQRMPLVLFYFHDMKLREIADALGMPLGTVQSSVHLARETLRRKLEGVLTET